jgi:hypothetical protein
MRAGVDLNEMGLPVLLSREEFPKMLIYSVYVLVVIVKKRLNRNASLYTIATDFVNDARFKKRIPIKPLQEPITGPKTIPRATSWHYISFY